MRGKSLLSDESDPQCYVCHTTYNLHVHHCFPGTGRRKVSDEEGCWVYLCAPHHNMSNAGVHFDKALDLEIRRRCQAAWEEREGIHDPEHREFIRVFGCNYLEEDE